MIRIFLVKENFINNGGMAISRKRLNFILSHLLFKSGTNAKKHVFGSDGTVAGMGYQTLACGLAKSWYTVSSVQICLAANGPAV